MEERKYKLKRKKIFDMCPGDLWVEEYFGGDVVRMFVGMIDEPETEMLWDDLIEIHFEEHYVWMVNVVMGSGTWLKNEILHVDAYPEHRNFDVLIDDVESLEDV